jgi:hypothetical protein
MKVNRQASSATRRYNLKRNTQAIEHVRMKESIRKQLERASPRASKRLTENFAIDLCDLVYVARMHQAHVNQLLKMRFPKDRTKFRKLLANIEVNLLFENQWHLTSIKRLLPRVVRNAYGTKQIMGYYYLNYA